LGNDTVKYVLEFDIEKEFIPELKDTSSDVYRWYNETVGELVTVA